MRKFVGLLALLFAGFIMTGCSTATQVGDGVSSYVREVQYDAAPDKGRLTDSQAASAVNTETGKKLAQAGYVPKKTIVESPWIVGTSTPQSDNAIVWVPCSTPDKPLLCNDGTRAIEGTTKIVTYAKVDFSNGEGNFSSLSIDQLYTGRNGQVIICTVDTDHTVPELLAAFNAQAPQVTKSAQPVYPYATNHLWYCGSRVEPHGTAASPSPIHS